jgi:hypothetical protein
MMIVPHFELLGAVFAAKAAWSSGDSADVHALIYETCRKQNIKRDELTIHADRGTSMRSKPVALLMADLGITRTHSRPHVANDNPFSEAQFKTMKCRPEFPARFGSIQDSRCFCRPFFRWYNEEHRHSGIGMLTPADMHFGRAKAVLDARQVVLAGAYAAHPERFTRGVPAPASQPSAVWINPPIEAQAQAGLHSDQPVSRDEVRLQFMRTGVSKPLTRSVVDAAHEAAVVERVDRLRAVLRRHR